jgi:N-methylhydantoinase B/oxoprolinase/acetone carboxylase alpha subunit
MASFTGDLAAMISTVELGVKLHDELIAKYGADVVRGRAERVKGFETPLRRV